MESAPPSKGLSVVQIPIHWHEDLPIFAYGPFLRSVSDEFGWLGGFDEHGRLRCVLPYTIIRKAGIRLLRFRVETIRLDEDLSNADEKEFLNKAVRYFRSIRADIIIPATTNSIFRTYPDGAIAVPYGTYIVDLAQQPEIIWSNINHTYRKNINQTIKRGVTIRVGLDDLAKVHEIIEGTFKRSGLPFMQRASFLDMISSLGEHVKVVMAESKGEIVSVAVYPYSRYSAYGVYGGSISGQNSEGAFKLIQWESMKLFREIGVQRYDFVGGRINPEKGSKQEGISLFKRSFGAKLVDGYIWKYPLSRFKYLAYRLAVGFLKNGDIVDQEKRRNLD
jgi:hypothetical protein